MHYRQSFQAPLTESFLRSRLSSGAHDMPNSGNLLLASLLAGDAAALQPHLKLIQLEHEKILFEAAGEVAAIYFPISSIVSLVVGLSSGEIVEAAMVGKDGSSAHPQLLAETFRAIEELSNSPEQR